MARRGPGGRSAGRGSASDNAQGRDPDARGGLGLAQGRRDRRRSGWRIDRMDKKAKQPKKPKQTKTKDSGAAKK